MPEASNVLEMDVDVLIDGGDDDSAVPAPSGLPTTRPRIIPADSDGGYDTDHLEGFPLGDNNGINDLDPELDEELLTQHNLTAAELLEGEFVSEEMRRHHRLSEKAMHAIRAHNFKVNVDLGSRAYAKMRRAFPQLFDLPSLSRLQSEISFISGLKAEQYDCCKNSCCCFVGVYTELDNCPYCEEPRRDSRGRPCATFSYLPLIPRLQALFADEWMCEELLYRARFGSKSGKISDIFDSLHYRRLRRRHVRVEEEILSHLFFDQDTDIAMGLSADGLRFLLDHLICFGVIPGPCEPKDLDSFLIPLRNEFWRLARGVATYNALTDRTFLLRAFLIRVFGDMPAIAKLMRMKGANGLRPCRACKIHGIRDADGGNKTNYVPLHRPNGESLDPFSLPLRTHDQFIDDAVAVEMAPSDAEAKRRSKATGINGLPILATLSSLSFPDSFGHDLMHLIPENIIKNLLTLWTGDFKGLDEGVGEYKLQPAVVAQIGDACVAAGDTTPAAFGARVPNLATQQHYFTAESYTLFTALLGPIVLRDRFAKPKYYKHFIELVSIFNDCLALTIDRDYVDNQLRKRIYKWVQDFEKYYYQYDPGRLSVCTLTLHAMIHIPDDILNTGPMWCYWNYATERFVGFLVRSSKSRKNPYASFARRLREIAQNNLIKVKYHLHRELDLSDRREEESRGHTIPAYPDICVLRPHIRGPLAPQVLKAVKNYLLRTFELSEHEISFTGGGDKIHAAELVMFIPERYNPPLSNRIVQMRKRLAVFDGFLDDDLAIDIPAFMIRPISPGCKYPLLLDSLKRSCPDTYPHREELQRGLAASKHAANRLNAACYRIEMAQTIADLRATLVDWQGLDMDNVDRLKLDSDFGTLLHNDTLRVSKLSNSTPVHLSCSVSFSSITPYSSPARMENQLTIPRPRQRETAPLLALRRHVPTASIMQLETQESSPTRKVWPRIWPLNIWCW
ncbi:hypothetical protein MSAN_01141700 [Mycena sanguinolenta]|uniref:DH domain-containing protein n=1 Tax=Mycena sanguinolenta TaxID=230812 RepID=A0A8H6YMS5_9AGAR|nr:hypothetical protein MSAN_01141700 [Mycena sanguinolenta]